MKTLMKLYIREDITGRGRAMKDLYDDFTHLDSITLNHSVRVMLICREYWSYSNDKDLSMLVDAALIHDIGKLYVSSAILDKVGTLSTLERRLVDLHPYIGYCVLNDYNINSPINSLVLFHHGFDPVTLSIINPLRNKDIEDMATMLHTVDVFEALTSDRPYHRGVSSKSALNMMSDGRDKTFHSDVLMFLRFKSENDRNSFVHRKKFSGSSPGCYVSSEEIRHMILNLDKYNFTCLKKAEVI